MIKSLYGKLVLTTIGIIIVSGLIAFFISNTYYHQVIKPENDEKNMHIALEIANYISSQQELTLETYLSNIGSIGYQLYIVDDQGEGQFFGSEFRESEISDETVSSVLNNEIYHGMKNFPRETFVTGFFANELSNTIGVPLNYDDNRYAMFLRPDIKLLFNELRVLFALLLGLSIFISILLVIFITKFLVKPITTLTNGTRSIADGNLEVNLDIDRNDELGELAASFNKMTDKLQQVEKIRKDFMNNVSHDIQSPLSNIKGYTDLLENNISHHADRDQRTNLKYLSIIKEETERLSHLTNQLLLLSSLKNKNDIINKEAFNLSGQLKKIIRNKQWKLDENEIMISYSIPDVCYTGDEGLLNEVWDNLLSNAIKYNQIGGSIDVSIIDTDSYVQVTFSDTGIGISSLQKERIFERFYRADSSRNQSVEGSGLGLTIVRMIVELHHGRIEIESEPTEGTRVNVYLPK
ncbi:sensor histidine kinase [Virgibacillus kimchii]